MSAETGIYTFQMGNFAISFSGWIVFFANDEVGCVAILCYSPDVRPSASVFLLSFKQNVFHCLGRPWQRSSSTTSASIAKTLFPLAGVMSTYVLLDAYEDLG